MIKLNNKFPYIKDNIVKDIAEKYVIGIVWKKIGDPVRQNIQFYKYVIIESTQICSKSAVTTMFIMEIVFYHPWRVEALEIQ